MSEPLVQRTMRLRRPSWRRDPAGSVAARILRFNEGRDPERLDMKYEAMRQSPFAFFRGTCHLFWEDWPRDSPLNSAPVTWECGDLHFENFGTYKGDNRLVYFDINDFDEAVLAACTRPFPTRSSPSGTSATGRSKPSGMPTSMPRRWSAIGRSSAHAPRMNGHAVTTREWCGEP